jgi:beta-lactam-binding protein with PASTA domain
MTNPGRVRSSLTSATKSLRGVMLAFCAMVFTIGAAQADVTLRVEARPPGSDPKIYAAVTNGGVPVTGLTSGAFSISIDAGATAAPQTFATPSGNLSIVFAMDYSGSVTTNFRGAMEDAVVNFITAMEDADKAAIVKFNAANPNKASVVQPFTTTDASGTSTLTTAARTDYPDPGNGTNIYDALILSLQQITSPPSPLPSGPKAVVLISDGVDTASVSDLNDVIAAANAAGIPVFTIGVGNFIGSGETNLQTIAAQTSAEYAAGTNATTIQAAYNNVDALLNNEYVLTRPAASVNGGLCTHTITVSVTGHGSNSGTFDTCTPVYAPDLLGMTVAEAQSELTGWQTTYGTPNGKTLNYGTATTASSTVVPVGRIISQTPAVGTEVTSTQTVNVVVSTGPAPANVPNVVGLTQAAATTAITNAQLVVGTVTQQSSTTVAAGIVLSQTPTAGASGVLEGAAVNLVVSSGALVPNVVGSAQAAAQTAITGAGLTVGTVTQNSSSTVAAGSVISQTPTANSSVAPGTAVNLVVSSGAPPSTGGGGGGGGGGGATGFFDLLAGLGLAALARRKRKASL